MTDFLEEQRPDDSYATILINLFWEVKEGDAIDGARDAVQGDLAAENLLVRRSPRCASRCQGAQDDVRVQDQDYDGIKTEDLTCRQHPAPTEEPTEDRENGCVNSVSAVSANHKC